MVLFLPAVLVAYLLHSLVWLVVVPFAIIVLALCVAALPIKRKVTPERFADELDKHLLGTEGPWDWDDTTSVAIADRRLEEVRLRLGPNLDSLSQEKDKDELRAIIATLRRGELPEVTVSESPNLEDQKKERELPRWVQVPAGIVLGSFTLLCGYASLVMLFAVNPKSPILAAVIGFVLLLGCFWVLEKCFRLLTGRKIQGGLLSPRALRVVSFFFLIFPIAGLFTGYYRRMGAIAVFQALMYVLSFVGLQGLARRREAEGVLHEGHKQDGYSHEIEPKS